MSGEYIRLPKKLAERIQAALTLAVSGDERDRRRVFPELAACERELGEYLPEITLVGPGPADAEAAFRTTQAASQAPSRIGMKARR